jgi:hypothetical protein
LLGEEGPITFDPAPYTVDGSSEYHTTGRQLERVAELITEALDGSGTAVYIRPTGNCCSNHKIEVNTCVVGFELLDADGEVIEPCDDSNPFTDVTTYAECQGCGAVNGTISHDAGLRFYSKTIVGECDCIPGNKALAEYFAEIEVYPKLGWNQDGGVIVVPRQAATLPEGQGFQWQARELAYLRYNLTEVFTEDNWGGKYGFPEDNDQLSHVLTNCKDSYCVISQEIDDLGTRNVGGDRWFPRQTVFYLIPKNDSTTITSFVTAFNNYFAGGNCGLPTVSCS